MVGEAVGEAVGPTAASKGVAATSAPDGKGAEASAEDTADTGGAAGTNCATHHAKRRRWKATGGGIER